MPKLILTTACAAATLGLMACQKEAANDVNAMNAEEMNYADNMTDMNDMNMTDMNMTDMNMSNDMGNATDSGNAATNNSTGY